MPAGLGPEEHIVQAGALATPFDQNLLQDVDILFAAEALARWGPAIAQWRSEQLESMDRVKHAIEPLATALRAKMPATVQKVAKLKDPAMIALLCVVLRWPDRRLPLEYVVGHRLVGHLQTTGLFRDINLGEMDEAKLNKDFFGQGSIDFISSIMRRGPTEDSQRIEELMRQETEKGYQSALLTKGDMDRKFGVGRWRPMPLFIHEERVANNA